jgi:DNA-binding transcriptional LysR family regulator
LAAAIGSFCDRHPDVFLHLISGSAQEVEQSILERRGDVGISVLASAHSALETIPLFSEDIYMFCGKRHPLYAIADKEIDGEMLRKHRVVESSILRAMTVEGLAAEDFKIRARANALDVRAIAILSGSFLGALPENYAAAWVQSGDMRPLLPSDMHERSAFHTIRHRATRPTRLVETFLSHLTQCSNAEPAALQD